MKIYPMLYLKILFLIILSIFLPFSSCGADIPVLLQESTGENYSAQLLEIQDNGVLVQRTESEKPTGTAQKISYKTLDVITFSGNKTPSETDSTSAPILLKCRDHSCFTVSSLTLEEGIFHIKYADSELQVKEAGIHFVLLQNSLLTASESEKTDTSIQKIWNESLSLETNDDILVVNRDGKLSYYRGMILGVSEKAVRFEMENDVLNINRDRVFGFILAKKPGAAPVQFPSQAMILSDVQGNRWTLKNIHLVKNVSEKEENEKAKISWETPLGLAFSIPSNRIAQIDFSDGRIIYLSSLKPESVLWTPYLSLQKFSETRAQYYEPRMDRSINGNPLKLQGQTYARGICMTSQTEITFRLPENYTRFQTIIGLDDEVRPNGDVTVIIRGDEKELFRENIHGKMEPIPVDLDISKIRRLTLFVDYGKNMDISDHTDFVDAKLIK
ncbi:MAG: NPCBM/NEW2 domain-containing protein [Planctomycetia bacterium]|nr:NPCBM/NEW2 domain-containing protein [Planctomycetia bacterium]